MLTRRQKLRATRWLLLWAAVCAALAPVAAAWRDWWTTGLLLACAVGYLWLARTRIRLRERELKIDMWWRLFDEVAPTE